MSREHFLNASFALLPDVLVDNILLVPRSKNVSYSLQYRTYCVLCLIFSDARVTVGYMRFLEYILHTRLSLIGTMLAKRRAYLVLVLVL